jgi:hypothetical protein
MVVNRAPHIRGVSADGENQHRYLFRKRKAVEYYKHAEYASVMCLGNKRKVEKMNRTQTNRKIIPIFFAVDDNYSSLLITALESLKDHTNPKYDYQIHILIEELSEKNVALISAMAEKNVTI